MCCINKESRWENAERCKKHTVLTPALAAAAKQAASAIGSDSPGLRQYVWHSVEKYEGRLIRYT